MTHETSDADPGDGRHESRDERSDRNWGEMLQETRITQTGTQILSGFLLTIAFQPKFTTLTAFQHTVYLVLVVAATLTTALALARCTCTAACFSTTRRARWCSSGTVCSSPPWSGCWW